MRFWRSIGLTALALAVFCLPAHAAPDSTATAAKPSESGHPNPERRGWMIGMQYGYGGARFVGNDVVRLAERRSDTPVEFPELDPGMPDWSGTGFESSGLIQGRIGYAVNPHWMLGWEWSKWTKNFGTYQWHFALSTFDATWYPGGGCWYLRGGAGIASYTEKVPDPLSNLFLQYNDRGFGFDFALGYEHHLLGRVSITPELTLRSMAYDGQVRSQVGTGALGLNWWF